MKYYAGVILLSLISNYTLPQTKTETNFTEIEHQQDSLKSRAFIILRDKCNTCHATKKRLYLFTWENMDSLQHEIDTQVFTKRKMPKGKRNQLSEQEERHIKSWLRNLK